MTEDESKTKWCPMVRTEGGVNNKGDHQTGTNCVGSRCMMWRNRYPMIASNSPEQDGYCGLAGKP